MTAVRPELRTLRSLAEAYSRNLPVRKVAAIGNAPLEPSAARAAEIDSADLVIRCNSFLTDRFADAPAQGSRTDIVLFSRLVPFTPDFLDDYPDRLYVMLEPMRMHGHAELWPVSWPADMGYVCAPNNGLGIPLNDAIGLPWREEGLAPTTGTTAIWLATELFPEAEVIATGISFLDDPGQTHWHHQFGDSVVVGGEHRIRPEAVLLQRLIDDGRVRMLSRTGVS